MGLSFVRGLLASINPCAFVLLPTYLMYFLGLEGHRPGSQRASVRRALVVAASVSAGFLAVFFIVGFISQFFSNWIVANAFYATAVIGVGFVILGIAMLRGFKLSVATPQLNVGQRDRTLRAMFLYGVAYAVASLGCTLPLFTVTLFGNLKAHGWLAGVLNVLAYGAGMALVVSALTVALAFARTGLLNVLRSGSRYIDTLSALLVIVSGLYMLYYFWFFDVQGQQPPIILAMNRFQARLTLALNNNWQAVAAVLGLTVTATMVYAFSRRRGSAASAGPAETDGQ